MVMNRQPAALSAGKQPGMIDEVLDLDGGVEGEAGIARVHRRHQLHRMGRCR